MASWEMVVRRLFGKNVTKQQQKVFILRVKKLWSKKGEHVSSDNSSREVNRVTDTVVSDSRPVQFSPNRVENDTSFEENFSLKNDEVSQEVRYWSPLHKCSDSAVFVLPKKEWDLVYGSVEGRYAKNKDWTDIVRTALKASNSYCSFGFKSHRWNKPTNSKLVFTCQGKCRFDTCQRTFRIDLKELDSKEFQVSYKGEIKHRMNTVVACPLKGSRRAELKNTLRHVAAREQHSESIKKLSEDVFESGNRDLAPNETVLKKARQEARKIQVLDESEMGALQKMFHRQRENSVGEKLPGVLRKWSGEPRSVMLWSEETLRIFHDRTQFDAAYIDATGSIITGVAKEKPFYAYEIVVRHPHKGRAPIAVGTYVANSHNATSIKHFIGSFKSDANKVCGKTRPRLLICDGSVPLIQSVLAEFFEESLETYLSRCFYVVTGTATAEMLAKPFLYLCGSHTMKNMKNLASLVKKRRFSC
uniref:Uncharacterized protein LOC108950684 n=1 Tax=Phallusia mammillata TaxID=59560 RepID=A0A6F9DK26_9ASCI|nr:uncharacterized protein LOC108950684 [Phallusia mammillata]